MFSKKTHIHFIGIGGIGMSGIARILAHRGYRISGCDLNNTQKSIVELKAIGCSISDGNDSPACADESINLIVYSSDIAFQHPELTRAREQNITTISRGELLKELTRTKYTLAVAGSHGKTTTTSLAAHVFMIANQDPSVMIGGYLPTIQSNARNGAGDFFITETDESDRSLLFLNPTLAILTNIDREHIKTYGTLHELAETFQIFLKGVPFYGKAIVCVDDPLITSLLPLEKTKTITYGSNPTIADWSYTQLTLERSSSTFYVTYKGTPFDQIILAIPGKHNVLNSIAVIAACIEANIEFKIIKKALSTFPGVERRFSFHGTFRNAEIFDDYGHHPTEIACVINVARNRAKNRVILIFQPHRYSRTKDLWHEFTEFFATIPADIIFITDIYPSNEPPLEHITSAHLVSDIQALNPQTPIKYIPYDPDFNALYHEISSITQEGDLILLQGAGSIVQFAQKLL